MGELFGHVALEPACLVVGDQSILYQPILSIQAVLVERKVESGYTHFHAA